MNATTPARYPDNTRLGGQSNSAVRELQIPAEMSHLEHALDEHENIIAIIAERFNPLLRQEPVPADGEKKPEEALAPIAERIRKYRSQVERATAQLQSLINRCEA